MKKSTVTFFNFGVLLLALMVKPWSANWNTNAILDQQIQITPSLAQTEIVRYDGSAASDETGYAEELDSLGIALHPGNTFMPESDGSPRSLNHCKSLVYRTLKSLPEEPVNHLKNLTLYFSDSGRRGLGGGDTVILRCQNVTDEELVGVLVHEMGHIHDTGVLQGSLWSSNSEFMDGSKTVKEDDPSIDFYSLSWTNEDTMNLTATEEDFVSGYAMTDPFEDFAESYAYYILHGTEFRQLAQENAVLQAKYKFLKNSVFDGKEYVNGEEQVDVNARHYDVTVLPYDMAKFFAV
ncbi:MAG: putative zinc-binding metallopeptidase [Candidatus Gracilibacteria bacterium]|nr:putative zinc-binding metallopeptidase [Candidatus Peregrinibacteria bacterium]